MAVVNVWVMSLGVGRRVYFLCFVCMHVRPDMLLVSPCDSDLTRALNKADNGFLPPVKSKQVV